MNHEETKSTSAITSYLKRNANIPKTPQELSNYLEPGDIIFDTSDSNPGHVMIYAGIGTNINNIKYKDNVDIKSEEDNVSAPNYIKPPTLDIAWIIHAITPKVATESRRSTPGGIIRGALGRNAGGGETYTALRATDPQLKHIAITTAMQWSSMIVNYAGKTHIKVSNREDNQSGSANLEVEFDKAKKEFDVYEVIQLAARRGTSPTITSEGEFCSQFVLSCYQAAALARNNIVSTYSVDKIKDRTQLVSNMFADPKVIDELQKAILDNYPHNPKERNLINDFFKEYKVYISKLQSYLSESDRQKCTLDPPIEYLNFRSLVSTAVAKNLTIKEAIINDIPPGLRISNKINPPGMKYSLMEDKSNFSKSVSNLQYDSKKFDDSEYNYYHDQLDSHEADALANTKKFNSVLNPLALSEAARSDKPFLSLSDKFTPKHNDNGVVSKCD